jgi:diguanylate cyclase (GGDEF)-like protein/PAS domain S-box-containing protein
VTTSPEKHADLSLPLAIRPGLCAAIAPHLPILDALDEGAYIVDQHRTIIYWNQSAERITGYSQAEVLGRGCREGILNHVDAQGTCLCRDLCPLSSVMATGGQRSASVYFHHKLGHRQPTVVRGLPLFDMAGEIAGAIELFTDPASQADLKERIAELEALAYLDPLTRLPNRRYLVDGLSRRIAESRRSGRPLGVAMFDIDHFKRLNDTHGHAAGDEVLKMVGRTMSTSARPSDVIGRWGGEEFVGIFPDASWESLRMLLERLRAMVAAAWLDSEGERISATVSAGGTIAAPEDTSESVLERADARLYLSKAEGRNRVSVGGPGSAAA